MENRGLSVPPQENLKDYVVNHFQRQKTLPEYQEPLIVYSQIRKEDLMLTEEEFIQNFQCCKCLHFPVVPRFCFSCQKQYCNACVDAKNCFCGKQFQANKLFDLILSKIHVDCECGATVKYSALHQHFQTECPATVLICPFCKNKTIGSLFTEHFFNCESVCIRCKDCGQKRKLEKANHDCLESLQAKVTSRKRQDKELQKILQKKDKIIQECFDRLLGRSKRHCKNNHIIQRQQPFGSRQQNSTKCAQCSSIVLLHESFWGCGRCPEVICDECMSQNFIKKSEQCLSKRQQNLLLVGSQTSSEHE